VVAQRGIRTPNTALRYHYRGPDRTNHPKW
jgi:hypothetical protein